MTVSGLDDSSCLETTALLCSSSTSAPTLPASRSARITTSGPGGAGSSSHHLPTTTSSSSAAAAACDGSNSCGNERPKTSKWLRIAIMAVLLALSLTAARYFTVDNLHLVVGFVQENPTQSLLLFLVVYSLGIVLMLPGMLLGIGAGAAYGLWVGTLLSWTSTMIGQTGAFLLGRYLLREPVSAFLAKKLPSFTEIDNSMHQEGWKLVLLLRLSPFIPYNVLNYALGVTSVDLRTYALVSAFAAFPYVFAFAYLGSASTDLYDVLQGDSDAQSDLEWTLALVGVIMVGVTVVGWLGQRLLVSSSSSSSREGYMKTKSCEMQLEVLPHVAPSSSSSSSRRTRSSSFPGGPVPGVAVPRGGEGSGVADSRCCRSARLSHSMAGAPPTS